MRLIGSWERGSLIVRGGRRGGGRGGGMGGVIDGEKGGWVFGYWVEFCMGRSIT